MPHHSDLTDQAILLALFEAAQPWGRLIKAEDVARLALFLLSDTSIPMTGSLIDQEQSYILGVRD